MSKKIVIPQEGFFFDNSLTPKGKERHDYYLDGRKMTGVTTVIGVISKPNLYQWFADMAIGSLGWLNPEYNSPEACMAAAEQGFEAIKALDVAGFIKLLSQARLAANNRKDDTADIGKAVHAWIEGYIKAQIKGELVHAPLPEIKAMCDKFVAWAKENVSVFLEAERKVYSREHFYAGTYDIMYLDKSGHKCIGDVKTANRIYDRVYFAQMAGYQICEEEKGNTDIFGRTIIRTGKDGSFEAVSSYDYETDKTIFMSALNIYRLNQWK